MALLGELRLLLRDILLHQEVALLHRRARFKRDAGNRTVELGGYRGVRDDAGRLIAMAGRRMNPPGHIEISAVCTDPAHRGRGLAGDLVRAVASEIERDGGIAFLHAAATNVGAIRLYRALGFEMRREITFTGLRAPV